jgi:hypothetical protein
MRLFFGALCVVFCILAGLIAIPTIGGASMCAISIRPDMILFHALPIAIGGFFFGMIVPNKWFISPVFLSPLIFITTIELFGHELDRFLSALALALVFLITSFLGAKLIAL